MKHKFIALTVLALFIIAGGQRSFATNILVSDTIHSDSTWSKVDVDTVKVVGDLTVENNVTLTIEPGIVVEFQGYYIFRVNGNLVAAGNMQDSIRFTMNPDSLSVGWQGLDILPLNALNDTTCLRYCIIEFSREAESRSLQPIKRSWIIALSGIIRTVPEATGVPGCTLLMQAPLLQIM